VLVGRNRDESERWKMFQAHLGFGAFYCRPGVDGAHEKGGVEGEGGRFRRNHCVPMPKVDSIAALNDLLADADAKDNHRRIANRARTVGADFLVEAPLLRPLPTAEFPTWLTLEPRVDRYARVTVRQCFYSVPAKLIGRRVRVRLGACTVIAFDGQRQVAVHERITVRGEQSLNGNHYLEVLRRKPGALSGATALVQARHLPAEDVIAGITAALRVEPVSPDVVVVEARKSVPSDGPTPLGLILPRVVDLQTRRTLADADVPVELPRDERPLPSVVPYDDLLTGAGS